MTDYTVQLRANVPPVRWVRELRRDHLPNSTLVLVKVFANCPYRLMVGDKELQRGQAFAGEASFELQPNEHIHIEEV